MFDVVSIALVVLGGIVYAWAYVEMQSLASAPHDPGAELYAGYRAYSRWLMVSRVALGVIALGLMAAVGAALYGGRRSRSVTE